MTNQNTEQAELRPKHPLGQMVGGLNGAATKMLAFISALFMLDEMLETWLERRQKATGQAPGPTTEAEQVGTTPPVRRPHSRTWGTFLKIVRVAGFICLGLLILVAIYLAAHWKEVLKWSILLYLFWEAIAKQILLSFAQSAVQKELQAQEYNLPTDRGRLVKNARHRTTKFVDFFIDDVVDGRMGWFRPLAQSIWRLLRNPPIRVNWNALPRLRRRR